jgi:hypothetical protein
MSSALVLLPEKNTDMNFRMDQTLRFWVDAAFENPTPPRLFVSPHVQSFG